MSYRDNAADDKWLLFFSSLPGRPVNNRVKLWRRLSRAGAVQLRGSVYVLPFSEEHVELLGWLVSEITSGKGQAAFVRVVRIDTVPDEEIIALFNHKKETDYLRVEKMLQTVERRIDIAQQDARGSSTRGLANQVAKLRRDLDEAQRTDFFRSDRGKDLQSRILAAQVALKTITAPKKLASSEAVIATRLAVEYAGKTWATRENPFVDRMASAWLIKRFIDQQARFVIMDEKQLSAAGNDVVAFDVRGGQFTHVGDFCTFEVLLRAFNLHDAVLAKMAELVHDLDLKDGRYQAPAAPGVEEMLNGIRKASRNDDEALERGMALFETLYVAKGR